MNSRDRKKRAKKSKKGGQTRSAPRTKSVKRSAKSGNIYKLLNDLQMEINSHKKKYHNNIITITEALNKEKEKLCTVDNELSFCKDEISSLKSKLRKATTEPLTTSCMEKEDDICSEENSPRSVNSDGSWPMCDSDGDGDNFDDFFNQACIEAEV